MPRRLHLIPLAAVTLTLAACGSDENGASSGGAAAPRSTAAATTSGATVNIKTFNYQPDPLEIEAGTEVTWVNEDGADHTVSLGTREQPSKEFDERIAQDGGKVSYTFDKPGTYDYFCTIHMGPGMTAQVIVK